MNLEQGLEGMANKNQIHFEELSTKLEEVKAELESKIIEIQDSFQEKLQTKMQVQANTQVVDVLLNQKV